MGQELNKLKKHKIISIVLMAIGALILLSGIALTAVIASPINSVEVTEMMNGQEVTTTKKISTFAFLINMLPNYQLSTLGYLQITAAAAGLVVGIVLLALGATFFVKTRCKTNEMLAALQDAEEEVAQEEQAEENVEATPTQQAEVKTEQLIGTQLVTTDVASTQAADTEEVQGDLLPPSQQSTEMRPAPLPMGSPKLLGPNQADHPQHGPRLMNAHPGQPRPQQAGPRPMGAGGSNQPRPMPNGPQNQQGPRPMNPQGNPRPQPPGPRPNGQQNSQPRPMPNNPQGPRPMGAPNPQPRPQQAGPRPMGAGGSNQPRPMPNGPQNQQGPRPMNPQGNPRPQPAGVRPNSPQANQPGPRPTPNNPQGPRPMGPRPNGGPNRA
ncbi:hypothetical protein [Mycoplasmoides gallisepticum]